MSVFQQSEKVKMVMKMGDIVRTIVVLIKMRMIVGNLRLVIGMERLVNLRNLFIKMKIKKN